MTTRCGFVALLGRPNAGKSTLLNALVGDKLAVVSRKPQTTRNRILGLAIDGNAQIAFIDTPGVHHAKGQTLINTSMNRVALQVAEEADLIVYLVDLVKSWTQDDLHFFKQILGASKGPVLVAATKADAVKHFFTDSHLARIENSLEDFWKTPEGAPHKSRMVQETAYLVSGKLTEMVDAFKHFMADQMPESPWLYAADDLTDMPESFVCSELVREQLFRQLGEEIPYGCAVRMTRLEERPDIVVIEAEVVVNRKQHKGMIIGEKGKRIKEIGTEARMSLEKHFRKKVFLELNVTVSIGWVSDQKLIAELAHIQELPIDIQMHAELASLHQDLPLEMRMQDEPTADEDQAEAMELAGELAQIHPWTTNLDAHTD